MARLIRPDDVRRLVEMVRRGGIAWIAEKIFRSRQSRIQSAWRHTASSDSNWWDLDAVVRRWNLRITGDPSLEYQEYVVRNYFRRRRNLRGLSIGCGAGVKEIRWASTSRFALIDAYDISSERIRQARESARASRWSRQLNFQVGDVHRLELVPASYDVVIFDHALHHCAPLAPVVNSARRWLKEDGVLVLNEYVGPDRFQWTDEQVELSNDLLRRLPEQLRKMKDGRVKDRIARYGSLAIRWNDPSEAAESSSILKVVQEQFMLKELKPYGGTILANVLKGIAHNFQDGTPEARQWLETLFSEEDRLLAEGRIPSDYVFAVLGRRD